MTFDVILTLVIIILAVGLLVSNRLRPDLVALTVLLALGLSGIVAPNQVFSGFSSSAVITILGISMISIGLQQTGATNSLGRLIHRIGGQREGLLVFLVSLVSAILSLFMNNIAAVGVLLPAVMSLSRRSKVSPSRLLIPLAFGTILGGMATLLTTSNIIVSGALKDTGLPSFGLLDFFPVGGPAALIGILFLSTFGSKLLPKKKPESSEEPLQEYADQLTELYEVEKNLIQFSILPVSPMVGKTIEQGNWSAALNLNILVVFHGKEQLCAPEESTILHAGDTIIARGELTPADAQQWGLKVMTADAVNSLVKKETHPFAEIVVSPHSRLIGKTIKEIKFRDLYSLNVIGVWRGGKPLSSNLSDLILQFGDALLVQGPAIQIHNLKENSDLLLLHEDPDAVLLPRKGLLAILITLITLTVAAFDVLPIAQVVLAGAVLLLITGCMSLNDAFHGIEWKAIFLIAGLWPLGIAVRQTGLAASAVNWLLTIPELNAPLLVTAIFLLLSMFFTLMISGQVSAIIMVPLALTAATGLKMDPRPFALAVAMGCSLAFMTPFGHPVNIMVMNPGGYTFRDYFRVGLPLTILVFAAVLIAIWAYWGL